MKHNSRRALGLAPLMVAAALAGCSSPSSPSPAPVGTSQGQDFSWVKSYRSVAEVRKDSSLVVHAELAGSPTSVPADEAGQSGEVSLIYPMRVTRTVVGSAHIGAVIKVRGLNPGPSGGDQSDFAVLRPSRQYLLFLTPFEFHKGKSTGQYVIVGQEAAYEIHGTAALRTTSRDSLVKSITVAKLESQAR